MEKYVVAPGDKRAKKAREHVGEGWEADFGTLFAVVFSVIFLASGNPALIAYGIVIGALALICLTVSVRQSYLGRRVRRMVKKGRILEIPGYVQKRITPLLTEQMFIVWQAEILDQIYNALRVAVADYETAYALTLRPADEKVVRKARKVLLEGLDAELWHIFNDLQCTALAIIEENDRQIASTAYGYHLVRREDGR